MPSLFSLLLCATTATTTFSQSSNANNYFCRGCATVVEHTWQQTLPLVMKFKRSQIAGTSANTALDIEHGVVKQLCGKASRTLNRFHPSHELKYTTVIQDSCTQLVDVNARVLSSGIAGTFPELSQLYSRTMEICSESMNLCDAPTPTQLEAYRTANPCDVCQMVVDDIQGTVNHTCDGHGLASLARKSLALLFSCLH